jgi:hypothetical protein
MNPDLPPTALETISRIREILETSRDQALTAVNTAMVRAYWLIGREITEEELRGADRAGYGTRLLNLLSERLSLEFGKGFDRSNLTNMRGFHLAFPNVDALRQELSWTHYRHLSRIQNENARAFYTQEAIQARWSTRELERQIGSFLFERLAKSRDETGVRTLAEQGATAFKPTDLLRDPPANRQRLAGLNPISNGFKKCTPSKVPPELMGTFVKDVNALGLHPVVIAARARAPCGDFRQRVCAWSVSGSSFASRDR